MAHRINTAHQTVPIIMIMIMSSVIFVMQGHKNVESYTVDLGTFSRSLEFANFHFSLVHIALLSDYNNTYR